MSVSTQKRVSISAIQGIIRRRILLNYAVDPNIVQRLLPVPFRPKLYNGFAVAGICMIRLEQVRPLWLSLNGGLSSENAAHRIAVEWTDQHGNSQQGVFIPRRDTDSRINHWSGGRLFSSGYHLAEFDVTDTGAEIDFNMQSRDNAACIHLHVTTADHFSTHSLFPSLSEASRFFEEGCDGFSPNTRQSGLDGIRLCVENWAVTPLQIHLASSAWFDDQSQFPTGTAHMDHALLMRDIPHQWRSTPSPK